MRDWFESLESREQVFVAAGAIAVVLALLYAFVWLPLDRGQQDLARSVASWERSLAELRPLKAMQQASGGSRPARSVAASQAPVVIVDQSLRARGLHESLQRSQPTTADGIRVEFEDVAFDDLVLWLGDLSRQYAMQVSSGSVSAAGSGEPGRVNATLTLERAS